jgi:(2Fe-2S) ferredoxin
MAFLDVLKRKPSRNARWQQSVDTPAFCLPDDQRPCLTLCSASGACKCGCDEVRQVLERELLSRRLELHIGRMKVGCNGDCPFGVLLGFPQRGFFYRDVTPEMTKEIVRETLEKGQIIFDLLYIDPLKATSGKFLYDKSGFIATIDDSYDMVEVARYFLEFEEGVSCGKCVPCRVGSVELKETLDRIIDGRGQPDDLQRLELLCRALQDAPYCDFGRTTSNPVVTILKHFRSEFQAYLD